MRAAIYGIEGNYLRYFLALRHEMRRRGHEACFAHPRDVVTKGIMMRHGVHFHFDPHPQPIAGVLTDDELDEIVSCHKTCPAYIADYPDLRDNLGKHAMAQASDCARFFQTKKIDMVFIFNGAFYPMKIAAIMARKLGLATEFFENGLLPHTTQIDPWGVNYGSSTGRISGRFFEQVKPRPGRLDRLKKDYFAGRPGADPCKGRHKHDVLTKVLIRYAAVRYQGFHLPYLLPEALRRKFHMMRAEDLDPLPPLVQQPAALPERPFVFLPLQVHDDSQIVGFSPRVRAISQLIEVVYDAVKAAFGDRMALVVKEHPADTRRGFDYPEIRAKYPDIYWFRTYDLQEMLDRCTVVVTVNSTVGLEGLLFYKPVITLGQAVYGKEGIAYPVEHLSGLSDVISSAVSTPVNRSLVDRYLFYLRYFHLTGGSNMYWDDHDIARTVDRIEADSEHKVWDCTAEELALGRLARGP